MQPLEGAKKGGVSGFLKGVGKGLMGVVTKPAGGAVDFAASSFLGVKRWVYLARYNNFSIYGTVHILGMVEG